MKYILAIWVIFQLLAIGYASHSMDRAYCKDHLESDPAGSLLSELIFPLVNFVPREEKDCKYKYPDLLGDNIQE